MLDKDVFAGHVGVPCALEVLGPNLTSGKPTSALNRAKEFVEDYERQ
jgi:hypothetical protein